MEAMDITFIGQHKMAFERYNKAKKYLGEEDAEGALFSVRSALESIVNELCDEFGISRSAPDGKERDLIVKIDDLSQSLDMTEQEKRMMHDIRIKGNKGAHGGEVTLLDARKACSELGELLTILEKRVNSDSTAKRQRSMNAPTEKKLTKSATNRKIAGVCGGIAEYFNIDPTIVRLIWAACVAFAGTGLLLYIIAALVMPESPDYTGYNG